MKCRFIFPLLLLTALALTTYPRLHRKLLHFQSHRAAEATTAALGPQLRDGDLIFCNFKDQTTCSWMR
ncbi:hypothetical protein BEN49_08610 [Hymenobacter coccineus]|uniref:Uncharacterized protein n=1 Tax=Hymenobacter coccineus TaxID=1908235 RepID=A0A1G1TFL1_9BACT|nr:hypothetical protein BEN49_08610 [Hymenobacter coccineus]